MLGRADPPCSDIGLGDASKQHVSVLFREHLRVEVHPSLVWDVTIPHEARNACPHASAGSRRRIKPVRSARRKTMLLNLR